MGEANPRRLIYTVKMLERNKCCEYFYGTVLHVSVETIILKLT